MEPSKTEVIEYFNARLPHYKQYNGNINARLMTIKALLNKITKPGNIALDVGCGVGVLSKHLADGGVKVTAIDIAPVLVDYAKEHANHENITYMLGDVTEAKFDQKFDLIILADVFEHIPREKVVFLSEIIKHNTHDNTLIYLNIPDYNMQMFMSENHPDKQQIIDEAWKMGDIISLFAPWDFIPTYMSLYGVDVAVPQYNDYIFIGKERLDDEYRKGNW